MTNSPFKNVLQLFDFLLFYWNLFFESYAQLSGSHIALDQVCIEKKVYRATYIKQDKCQ